MRWMGPLPIHYAPTASSYSEEMFRRVGGFVYLMSALIGLEGSLEDVIDSKTDGPWSNIDRRLIFNMLHQIFAAFAVAMRYEPANANFFYQEMANSFDCMSTKVS